MAQDMLRIYTASDTLISLVVSKAKKDIPFSGIFFMLRSVYYRLPARPIPVYWLSGSIKL